MVKIRARKTIHGNALWFILIAIFLLAGLTMLITRTSQQTEETGDVERYTITATEIMRYSAGLTSMADTLRLRECSVRQLSFEVTPTDGYQNSFSPTDESCHMFKASGTGGTRISKFGGTDYTVLYNALVNIEATNSGQTDLVMLIEDIPRDLCLAINKVAGVGGSIIPSDAGAAVGVTSTPFTGTYLPTGTNITNEPSASALANHKTGCVQFVGRSILVFYSVIVGR